MADYGQYAVFAAGCFLLALVLLGLVLRERIMLQGSLSFVGFLAVLATLTLFPNSSQRLAHALGFTLLSNFFFTVSIALLSLLHLRSLITLSKVHMRTVTLTQELAILQERLEAQRKTDA